MNDFNKQLRAFASDEISKPGEHKRRQIADKFLAAHPDLAHDYVLELASTQVAKLIKQMCDESGADPLPLFSGFPAAIVIAPGVVKATANCTLDDLGAGLEYRKENLRHAQERFEEYGRSMAAFVSLRASESETVGECQARLREQGPVTEEST